MSYIYQAWLKKEAGGTKITIDTSSSQKERFASAYQELMNKRYRDFTSKGYIVTRADYVR